MRTIAVDRLTEEQMERVRKYLSSKKNEFLPERYLGRKYLSVSGEVKVKMNPDGETELEGYDNVTFKIAEINYNDKPVGENRERGENAVSGLMKLLSEIALS